MIKTWQESYMRGDAPNIEFRVDLMQREIDELRAALDVLNASNESYITLANTAYEITEQRTRDRDELRAANLDLVYQFNALREDHLALKASLVKPVYVPKCSCCGTTENLHKDFGSGGPYRCNSSDCMVF